MNYKQKAREYIDQVNPDCGIVEESIEDLVDFYGFIYQSKKFLETDDFSDMLVGNGYVFLSKTDQRIFCYGSREGVEKNLQHLRNKVSNETIIRDYFPNYDHQREFILQIVSSSNEHLLADILQNKVYYIIPEIVGGSIYRIPSGYRKKLLYEKLQNLPHTFNNIEQEELDELLLKIIKLSDTKVQLIVKKEIKRANYESKAKTKDLEPIW